jgi:hypothetical protein
MIARCMRTKTARAIPVVLEDLGIGRLFEQTCEAAIVTADYGLARGWARPASQPRIPI